MELGDILCSPNGTFTLIFQGTDGDLVIYKNPATIIWASATENKRAVKACLLQDGKFVINDSENVELWRSRSGNLTGTEIYAMIEDSGSLAIYEGTKRRWSSGLRFKL